eukprot:1263202-Rhodomonas_salina.2
MLCLKQSLLLVLGLHSAACFTIPGAGTALAKPAVFGHHAKAISSRVQWLRGRGFGQLVNLRAAVDAGTQTIKYKSLELKTEKGFVSPES